VSRGSGEERTKKRNHQIEARRRWEIVRREEKRRVEKRREKGRDDLPYEPFQWVQSDRQQGGKC
jgi:hypothetical protein